MIESSNISWFNQDAVSVYIFLCVVKVYFTSYLQISLYFKSMKYFHKF